MTFAYAQDNKTLTASLTDSNEIVITIVHSFHIDYGCAYPLTYKIKINQGAHGLIALRKYGANDRWLSIQEKTSNDFFNGIEAARFDYNNNLAYVSASFSSQGDSLFIRIIDSLGNICPVAIQRNL